MARWTTEQYREDVERLRDAVQVQLLAVRNAQQLVKILMTKGYVKADSSKANRLMECAKDDLLEVVAEQTQLIRYLNDILGLPDKEK